MPWRGASSTGSDALRLAPNSCQLRTKVGRLFSVPLDSALLDSPSHQRRPPAWPSGKAGHAAFAGNLVILVQGGLSCNKLPIPRSP
jgi:hypothetical protein